MGDCRNRIKSCGNNHIYKLRIQDGCAELLLGRAAVFYIPKDNPVVIALESIITVANDKKIPLFVGEGASAKCGVFASYELDYHDLGYSTGTAASDNLNG